MGLAKRKYQQPPRTGMDAFMMLPAGTLAELINDTIYMSPAPDYLHQKIVLKLASDIQSYAQVEKMGECIISPIDVFFDSKNVLQPDILFITSENMDIIKNGKVKGVPDIIIEILSFGNKRHDTEKKKTIYEKFGVKEYFIIDPENKDIITYFLSEKKYVKQPAAKGKIKSKLLKKTFSF
jgi:Uma2 family endonuclease